MVQNLVGTYDLHIHTMPDVKARKLDNITYVEKCIAAGMAGVLLKNHMAPTVGCAQTIQKMFPGFNVVGGIVLNPSVGGINSAAVEAAAKMGGRVVWFPTLFAKDYLDFKKKTSPAAIDILGPDGELCPSVKTVLQIAAEYNLVVATGHLSQKRAALLAREAIVQGVKKIWFTHINHPCCALDEATKIAFREEGVFFELSYHPALENMATLEDAIKEIRLIGPSNIILTTDLGQPELPDPVEGLSEFFCKLQSLGITDDEIKQMAAVNPMRLLSLDS